jgi:hypothetical protein
MLFTPETERREMEDATAAARAITRWLAPYFAEELGLSAATGHLNEDTSATYDDAICASYVSTLGDVVLEKAEVFFGLLADHHEVGSLALAKAIGVTGPRNIPGVLTTPLKRRAKALALPYPWREDSDGERTLWVGRAGVSSRMVQAVNAERARRLARSRV